MTKPKILYVDDEELNHSILKQYFNVKNEYDLVSVLDGEEALEQALNNKFDVFLVDIMMPGISGVEVLNRVREKKNSLELPILMVTALSQTEKIIECLKLGANDYVTKPVNFPILFARIETQLTIKNLHIKFLEGEEKRKELQKQVFQSSKLAAVGELAAGVGHEVNNPLAIINGYFEIIRREIEGQDIVSENISEGIGIIGETLERVSTIIKALRTYSSIEHESLGNVNVAETIEQTVDLVKSIYDKINVEIELNFGNRDLVVTGNKGLFQQVIMNLLSNAKEAIGIKKHGGKISFQTESDGENIKLIVEDDGCGISEEEMDRIFDLFYTTKEIGTGAGLGLNHVHTVIAEMNGNTKVESTVDEGARFILTIPAASNLGNVDKE